ncbi:unnamed protein product [Linum tenue]|uniref:Uncharacterized protein n=1 Tax=Linum tenue TaxID=586396 RepID=A0AAV0J721_9ROSI|nr:unnamed protein product [Linum tenue]
MARATPDIQIIRQLRGCKLHGAAARPLRQRDPEQRRHSGPADPLGAQQHRPSRRRLKPAPHLRISSSTCRACRQDGNLQDPRHHRGPLLLQQQPPPALHPPLLRHRARHFRRPHPLAPIRLHRRQRRHPRFHRRLLLCSPRRPHLHALHADPHLNRRRRLPLRIPSVDQAHRRRAHRQQPAPARTGSLLRGAGFKIGQLRQVAERRHGIPRDPFHPLRRILHPHRPPPNPPPPLPGSDAARRRGAGD